MRTNEGRWKEAIAYRRVSTDKQGESGVGLEGQLAAIDRYAELDRYRISESFVDVGSGRGARNLVDRPQLQAAIEVAKATGRPIIVSGLDRLSREANTIEELFRHGLKIIVTGEGLMRDPVIIASEAARAQREGELISQRTKEALAEKKAEGVLLGNRKNLPEARRLAAERKRDLADDMARKIVVVLDDRPDEKLTAREIVAILNERGVSTSTGLRWTVPALRRPLARARSLIKQREKQEVDVHYKNNPLFGRF